MSDVFGKKKRQCEQACIHLGMVGRRNVEFVAWTVLIASRFCVFFYGLFLSFYLTPLNRWKIREVGPSFSNPISKDP